MLDCSSTNHSPNLLSWSKAWASRRRRARRTNLRRCCHPRWIHSKPSKKCYTNMTTRWVYGSLTWWMRPARTKPPSNCTIQTACPPHRRINLLMQRWISMITSRLSTILIGSRRRASLIRCLAGRAWCNLAVQFDLLMESASLQAPVLSRNSTHSSKESVHRKD